MLFGICVVSENIDIVILKILGMCVGRAHTVG